MRNRNTRGGSFAAAEINAVWAKGKVVSGHDAAVHRQDACGKWMQRDQYGKESQYGWEVDHIKPVSKGGGDDLANLQPLHWRVNRHKSNDWPNWTCPTN